MKKKIENNKKLILLLVTLLIFAFSISANAASWPSFGSSKPIRAYTISSRNNTTAYSDANLKKKRGTIYASDEIYIYSIGSNASSTMVAYCSYPVPGGRKYAFIPLQAVTNVRYPGELNTARSSVITYRRPGSSTRAGSISKNDKVYKLSVSGSYTQVLYNIGSASNPTGWRMAWITTSNYNNYIKQAYNPQGYLDAVSSNATGKITVSGWAFDRDSLSSSLQIHVYVGGPAGSGAPGYSITANQRRTDVNNAYLGVGNYHGFSNTISVSRTGTQTVYVYAINVGGGQNVLLGSKTITIQDTNSTLRISGQASPGTMYQGAGFTIRGTISSNYKITKVKCGIYTSSGATVSEKTVYPNSYSYNVNNIDSYIHFSYAKPGTNYYRVWATDAKGTKLLQNSRFEVKKRETQDLSDAIYSPISYPMKGYRITQSFGHYSSSMARSKGRPYHSGIDMVSSQTDVFAAADGTVIYTGYSSGNGNHVIISHTINGRTFKTLYSHLSSISCTNGTIRKGQKIGVMGSTGNSTGPHLHFAVFTGNTNDPLGYVSKKTNATILTENTSVFYDPVTVIQSGGIIENAVMTNRFNQVSIINIDQVRVLLR